METAVVESTETLPEVRFESEYQLVAVDQPQLQAAHDKMIEWAHGAQQAVAHELVEEVRVLDHEREQKWAIAPHNRRIKQLNKRLTFYGKIEEALRAGYVIIPNFQMTAFAIRTKAEKPHGAPRDGDWYPDAPPQTLPAGEGEYRNPSQLVSHRTEIRPASYDKTKTYEQVVTWPVDWQDAIEFPIALAKPALMQRTAQVMAKRLFDEIGVATDASFSSARGDPVIIGRIRNPRSGRPAISFFVGWYFDPSRL